MQYQVALSHMAGSMQAGLALMGSTQAGPGQGRSTQAGAAGAGGISAGGISAGGIGSSGIGTSGIDIQAREEEHSTQTGRGGDAKTRAAREPSSDRVWGACALRRHRPCERAQER